MDLTLWEDTTCTILFDSLLNVVEKTSGLDGNLHPRSSRVENTCICTNQLVKLTISNYMAHYCTIQLRGFPSFLNLKEKLLSCKADYRQSGAINHSQDVSEEIASKLSFKVLACGSISYTPLTERWMVTTKVSCSNNLEQISPVVY
jgi:hypothetical protein